MTKKILLTIFICLLLFGCKKEVTYEKEVIKEGEVNNKIGDLNFYIPDNFKADEDNTDTIKQFGIDKPGTKISLWFTINANYKGTIEEFMKDDKWFPDFNVIKNSNYNDHIWLEQVHGEYKIYTKYKNDVYAIFFNVMEDEFGIAEELKEIIPRSFTFRK